MFRSMNADGAVHLTILLVPGYAMVPFTCLLDTMRLANTVSDQQLYSWEIVSRDGDPVPSACDIEIMPKRGLADCERPDNLLVCAGIGAHLFNDALTIGWLRRWARMGSHLGAVCNGPHVLARAGLLNGYRSTIHWSSIDTLSEEFPEIEVRPGLFELDRDRFTCAGGIASLDMMLHHIRLAHGRDLAGQVAELFMMERIRDGDDDQRLPLQVRGRLSHPVLLRAIREMESHTEDILPRDALSSRLGISTRQLERLFQSYLGTSPSRYYLGIRLKKARALITQTSLPVFEIAVASGFSSASHFTKRYQEFFGATPRDERRALG